MTSPVAKMVYWVDQQGTIVRAESAILLDLAQKDAVFAAPFKSDEVVGKDLFSFIEGMEVRHIYALLNARVLATGRSVRFEYRCDSPEIRRDMEMTLSPDQEAVRYESTVLRETRRATAIPVPASGSNAFVVICSFCKRYRYPRHSKHWKDLEVLLTEARLPDHFSLSHTACPDCYDHLMRDLLGENSELANSA